jgi:D-alanine-D-alanine ligase
MFNIFSQGSIMKNTQKLRVAVIFGGKSAEHEVSLQSARNILNAMDKKKFEPVLIGIDKDGVWRLSDAEHYLLNSDNPKLIALNKTSKLVAFHPGAPDNQLTAVNSRDRIGRIDVIFPVLHGPYGEDGAIQGLFKLANIPFVGPGVLGSAVGMDKDVMKRLFRDARIPIADFFAFSKHQKNAISFEATVKRLGLPLFVKPANLGSSVGISKVKTKPAFKKPLPSLLNTTGKSSLKKIFRGAKSNAPS